MKYELRGLTAYAIREDNGQVWGVMFHLDRDSSENHIANAERVLELCTLGLKTRAERGEVTPVDEL